MEQNDIVQHCKHLPKMICSFLRYSPDSKLLKLQEVAMENQHGSIWSGIKKNIVLGARQEDFSNCDESVKHMSGFDPAHLAHNSGFPIKFNNHSLARSHRFQPWDERKKKKELETATRSQFKEHRNRILTLPYGFIVDMQTDQDMYVF